MKITKVYTTSKSVDTGGFEDSVILLSSINVNSWMMTSCTSSRSTLLFLLLNFIDSKLIAVSFFCVRPLNLLQLIFACYCCCPFLPEKKSILLSLNIFSQIAVVIEDTEFLESSMNGIPWRAGKFALSLRLSLWSEHLGLPAGQVGNLKNQVRVHFLCY